jgi:hypothetical protein
MKKLFAAVALTLVCATACGGGDEEAAATPTPSPAATGALTGQIMGPVDKARDTVDQLNQQQEQNPYSGDN